MQWGRPRLGEARKSRIVIGNPREQDQTILNQAARVKRREADKAYLEAAVSGMFPS